MPRFGLHLTSFHDPHQPEQPAQHLFERTAALAELLERATPFGSLWLTDHVQHLGPEGPTAPMPEAYMLLAALAGRTRALRLGVLATAVTYRPPSLLAKMLATLDVVSGGRAILGIGAAHPRTEAEQRSYGIDFPPLGQRMDRLEEALQVIRALFREAVATFDGRFYRLDHAHNFPRPLQPGGPPILVAGSGERRLLRLVARYADQCNLSFPSGDHLAGLPHKLELLASYCQAVGRDPAEITTTYKALLAVDRSEARAHEAWQRWRQARQLPELGAEQGVFVGTPAQVVDGIEAYFAAGIDEMIFELPDAFNLEAVAAAGEALSGVAAARVPASRA